MKKRVFVILSIALFSFFNIFFIIGCNDKDEEAMLKSEKESHYVVDGERTAVYYTSSGNKMEIIDTWKRNILVERTVNGHPAYAPNHNHLFHGRNADIRAAEFVDKLVKNGWPCVRILHYGTSFTGEEEYYVEYDVLEEDGDCWYDKEEGL
ncbi:MAG: hypothetical protein IJ759_07820 [Bacteroidales bacterium]|nr:hypothetical protein [Bacteroidales bacterium]